MSLGKQAKQTKEIPPQHLAKEPKLGFAFLLICLISSLLVPSYFDHSLMSGLALNITLSVTLLSGLYLVAYRLKELLTGVLLAIPVLLTSWGDSLDNAVGCLGVLIGRFLFETDRISLDMILASICLYLLIGLIWAFIYQLIVVSHPGAFEFVTIETTQMEAVRYMRGNSLIIVI